MKWVLSHASDDIHHWQLQHEDESKSLVVNLQRLSLRLSGISKRLFFLNLQGFLHKKILLRTEYGVVMGETAFADKIAPGQLVLNGQKFYYRYKEGCLYLMDSEKQVIATCDLSVEATTKLEVYSLLFGFVWFSTADADQKERTLSTAV